MNTPAPDPYIAWQVVLTLGVLVAIAINVWTAARAGRAQKREVTFGFDAASRSDFSAHVNECKSDRAIIRAEIADERRNNEVHSSARSKTLFDKIDKVELALSTRHEELSKEMQRNFLDTERALGRIEGKLDETKRFRNTEGP